MLKLSSKGLLWGFLQDIISTTFDHKDDEAILPKRYTEYHSKISTLYGLPRILKVNISMEPIVSGIGCATV